MPYVITVERDSVCMGDDVTAPNMTTVPDTWNKGHETSQRSKEEIIAYE